MQSNYKIVTKVYWKEGIYRLELLGHSLLDGLDDERRLFGDVGLGRGRRDAGQLRHAWTVLTAARNRQKWSWKFILKLAKQ